MQGNYSFLQCITAISPIPQSCVMRISFQTIKEISNLATDLLIKHSTYTYTCTCSCRHMSAYYWSYNTNTHLPTDPQSIGFPVLTHTHILILTSPPPHLPWHAPTHSVPSVIDLAQLHHQTISLWSFPLKWEDTHFNIIHRQPNSAFAE